MTCAACQARVEKAVSKVDGVTSCSVSLLTNSMGVEGTASDTAVIKAVVDAGYGASAKDSGSKASNGSGGNSVISGLEESLKDTTTPLLAKRLVSSLVFLLILMYFSMGHMMWGWPLPKVLENNHVAMGLIQMLLTIIIMVINQRFFISGIKSALHGSPNMDTLVALGSGAAFVYSTYALFAMTDAQMRMDMDGVMHYMHEFYFESAAMILTLITIGKMLEAHSKGKTTDALKSLMKLAATTATVVIDGEVCTLIRSLLNIVEIALKCIKTLEKSIDETCCYLHLIVADLRENILHIMCEILHSLVSHGSCHSLKRMCCTEYLVNCCLILRLLL